MIRIALIVSLVVNGLTYWAFSAASEPEVDLEALYAERVRLSQICAGFPDASTRERKSVSDACLQKMTSCGGEIETCADDEICRGFVSTRDKFTAVYPLPITMVCVKKVN